MATKGRVAALLLSVAVGLLCGCGGQAAAGGDVEGPVVTDVEGRPVTLTTGCGGVPLPTVLGDPVAALPPYDGDVAALFDDPRYGIEGEYFLAQAQGAQWFVADPPGEGYALVARAATLDDPSAPGHLFVRVEGDPPRASGWGQCRVESQAAGYGNARLRLASPAGAADRTLTLAATEQECASGEVPQGREIRTVVIEGETTIDVLVLVEPVQGGADCPSNPEFGVEVRLERPVGDRVVRDASVVPARALGGEAGAP